MKKGLILVLVAAIAVVVVGGVWRARHGAVVSGDSGEEAKADKEEHGKDEPVKLTDEQLKDAGIQLTSAEGGELAIKVSLPGEVKLNADRLAHVVPRYAGAIKEIHKRLGDRVHKGETLAVIESNDSLSIYQVKALLDGTIIQKHATIGEMIPENTEIFVVANLDTVWVDMNVYPKDLPYVREGQRVDIVAAGGTPAATGKIDYVGPMVSEHTRTALARVVLPNPGGQWRPGMFVTGKVAVEKVPVALRVPKDSVQSIEGAESVFVKTDKGFVPKPVKLGREDDRFVEVKSGLQSGETYVSAGAFLLKAEKGKGDVEED